MKLDVHSIINGLLVKYPLFGSIIANTKFVEDKETTIASTDGSNIFYNEDFLYNLNEEKQIFVFAHEICHIAFDHIFRSENKDVRLWNIATDSVINALLVEDGLEILDNSIYNPEAIKYNAEELYEKLLKEQNNDHIKKDSFDKNKHPKQNNDYNQEKGSNNSSDNIKGRDSNDSETNESLCNKQNINDDQDKSNDDKKNNPGHDDHSLWEKAINDKKENVTNDENQAAKDKYIEKLSKTGENKSFEKNKECRENQLTELMDSLTEKKNEAGNEAGNLDRLIENIGTSKSILDWRKILKETITYDVDWSYSDATIEQGVVTPHLEGRETPLTEIVLDTSGSISISLLKNFLRECKNILQASRIKVGCFDTQFYGFSEIRTMKDIDNMQFSGGGGTAFDAAVGAFSKRVDNKIIFTDGCAPMPYTKCNAIWIVFGDAKICPPGGKVIYINEKQFKQLTNTKFR